MTPARILIVEDDRIVARDIGQQLARIGHSVAGMAANGPAAIALALDLRPDLILMDVRLSGPMDGVETALRIREQTCIPVVYLTAYADDDTVTRASTTEPFGYLLKPFENSQLRTVIEMALYKHNAERRLRESERRYAATLSSIGDAVIATDTAARITFVNPVAERLTGWTHTDALGLPVEEVFVAIHDNAPTTIAAVSAKPYQENADGEEREARLVSRSGHEIPIEERGSPIIDDDGVIIGAVLVFRDITERLRTQDALRSAHAELARVSRLTAMGELAVSIAHEINQPLGAVAVNASAGLNFVDRDPPDIAELRQILQEVLLDARRAGDVIRSLQALARKSGHAPVPLRLDALITEVLGLSHSELQRHRVTVRTQLAAGSLDVHADRVQIQQLLLNLVSNAVEAMSTVDDRPRVLTIASQTTARGTVAVVVEDAGPGIPDGARAKIFDAFFTTKTQGLGIGLAICRSIVEAHGGQLSVQAGMPHGTVFRFELPEANRG